MPPSLEPPVLHPRAWRVVFPLGAAFLAGIAFSVRRHALDTSNQPLFFAAVLATVAAACLAASLCTGGVRGRLLRSRRALWPFVIAGAFETAASLCPLIAVSVGRVMAAPLVATSPCGSRCSPCCGGAAWNGPRSGRSPAPWWPAQSRSSRPVEPLAPGVTAPPTRSRSRPGRASPAPPGR